jgi:hypothetical protein
MKTTNNKTTATALKRGALIAAVLTSSIASGAASAAMLSVNGGSNFILGTNGTFNPQPGGAAYNALDPGAVMRNGDNVTEIDGATKYGDNTLGLMLDTAAMVTFTYMGKEAAYTNIFIDTSSGSTTLFDTSSANIGDTRTVRMDAGLLGFSFQTTAGAGGGNGSSATNSDRIGVAYSALFNGDSSIILGFNDIASVDADFDDLVLRVDVAAVPIPATAWLFGSGLIGLVGIKRRKS